MVKEFEAYHGSDNDFNEFDVSFIKSSMYGWGLYFTTDIELAMDYGKKIYTVEIPDNSEILDLDMTDEPPKQMFYDLIADDVRSMTSEHPYMTDEDIEDALLQLQSCINMPMPLYQFLWRAEGVYKMLLGGDIIKSKMAVSDLAKDTGYIGCKHATILCIFDPSVITIKYKEDAPPLDESTFSFKKIVNESLSKMVYHFTNLLPFLKMVETDTITFSKVSKEETEGPNVNKNLPSYGKYYLSTTRVKDSRLGYSIGHMVRIELNSDAFNANFKAKPISFFVGDDGKSAKYRAMSEFPNNLERTKSIMGQVESEDRIWSNVSKLHNIERYINRVDILLRDYNNTAVLKKLKPIYSGPLGTKTFIYTDRRKFDTQGENVTEDVLELMRRKGI